MAGWIWAAGWGGRLNARFHSSTVEAGNYGDSWQRLSQTVFQRPVFPLYNNIDNGSNDDSDNTDDDENNNICGSNRN